MKRFRRTCISLHPNPGIRMGGPAANGAAQPAAMAAKRDAAPRRRELLRVLGNECSCHPGGGAAAAAATGAERTADSLLIPLVGAQRCGASRTGAPLCRPYRRPIRMISLADVAATAATGRAHMQCRLGADRRVEPATGTGSAGVRVGEPAASGLAGQRARSGERPKVAFLFTGQGSQYAGMGRQLYDTRAGIPLGAGPGRERS